MAFFQPTSASSRNNLSIVPGFQSDPFISGLNLTWLSATTFSVSSGVCRAYGNDDIIALRTSVTVDTSTVGLNGCFPFAASLIAPTNNTSFGVYLIDDATGVLGQTVSNSPINVQGLSSNTPKIVVATGNNFLDISPVGNYQTWRRIGTIVIAAGTNNIVQFLQSGADVKREVTLTAGIPLLSAGAATTLTQLNLSGGNLPLNPYFASQAKLTVAYTPALVGNSVGITNQNVVSATTYPLEYQNSAAAAGVNSGIIAPGTAVISTVLSSVLYYIGTASDSTSINVVGWTDDLGLQAI